MGTSTSNHAALDDRFPVIFKDEELFDESPFSFDWFVGVVRNFLAAVGLFCFLMACLAYLGFIA